MRSAPAVLLRSGLVLLVVSAAACGPDAGTPGPPAAARPVQPAPRPRPSGTARPPPTAPLAGPARPEPVVFDTVEPPEAVQRIPPPPPPPSSHDRGRPVPPPRPPGPSGSCDVRETENYCFTYTGPGWTPETAVINCSAAPRAAFRDGPCPEAGAVATCTFRRPSEPTREIVYTTYAPADLDLARLACPGTFATVE
jgi:hypothetical protein